MNEMNRHKKIIANNEGCVAPLIIRNIPRIAEIPMPNDVEGSKILPYSAIAACVLLAGYSLWTQGSKADEVEEEEVEEN